MRLQPSPNYKGYHSFDYLEAGTDYEVFDIVDELDRVPEYDLGLTAEQEERTRALLTGSIAISLHEHPKILTTDPAELPSYNRTGRNAFGFEALARSGMTAVIDNFMDGTNCVTSIHGWKWDDIIIDLGLRFADVAKQDHVFIGTTIDDIREAHETDRLALIPGLEAATMIENELDRLDVLYGYGVRQIGVAYSMANQLGAGLSEPSDGGLTIFGHKAIERMNKLGLAIDISHCGDRTGLDVIKASRTPVLITHAGSRTIWPSRRMKDDETLIAMAERGGVIGLEAAPHTTISRDHTQHSLESVMDHFQYCVDLIGIDHVAFGPDTNFGDHVGLHNTFSGHLRTKDLTLPDYERVPYVAGLENPQENFINITGWLVKHGYSDDEIKKVLGGNILAALEQIW